jgi:hypothetical protein
MSTATHKASRLDSSLINFITIVIDDDDLAIAIAGNIDRDLVGDILGDMLRLRVVCAVDAHRIFQSKSIDDLEMIFRHCPFSILSGRQSAIATDVPESGTGRSCGRSERWPERNDDTCIAPSSKENAMPAFVEMIVQKIAEAAPIENSVSDFVAGVLENTANKLSRFDQRSDDSEATVEDVA